jgi:DNA-binding NarL/FixJ family response regulator
MRVMLADDSALIREGLTAVLVGAGFDATGFPDARALMAALPAALTDVVITDIRMPPTFSQEGIDAALAIRREHPSVAVLVLSQYLEAAYASRLLDGDHRGGLGYLLKDRVTDIPAFIESINRVAAGETLVDPDVIRTLIDRRRIDNPLDALTPRERDVLTLMAEGRSNHGIGGRLHLSPKTVETHVGVILAKLGIEETPDENRRVRAVLAFLRSSLHGMDR